MKTPAQIYADGLRDGVEMTLVLALGDQNPDGGKPFALPEKLPPEFKHWATAALRKVKDDRLMNDSIAEALYRRSSRASQSS